MVMEKEKMLLSLYIQSLNSRYRLIWGSSIESDKRKRAKTIRKLIDDGYLVGVCGNDDMYVVTEKTLEFRESVTPYDLKAKWLERARSTYYEGRMVSHQLPVSLFGDAIIEMKDDPSLLWYVGHRKDMINIVWGEEMTYRQAMEALRNAGHDPVFAVSSPELEAFAKETTEKEHFMHLYVRNLDWGLKTLLIAGEDDEIPMQLHYSTGWPGCGDTLTKTDAEWEPNLLDSIERLTKSIAERTTTLAVLKQIKTNVESFGGWNKFKEAYALRLKEELAKRNEEDPR
jgi:hypothetical protein